MAALADVLGGNAPLGRKLGYKDGANVGQMISGLRPITEKTIAKAEEIRDEALPQGTRGWFSRDVGVPHVGEAPPPPYLALPPEYLQAIENLRVLGQSQRSSFLDQLHQAAELAREIRADERRKDPEQGKVAAARRSHTTRRATTSMKWGDGNRQQTSLPLLVPARDPFTAAPSDREAKFYERLEHAPKAAEEAE